MFFDNSSKDISPILRLNDKVLSFTFSTDTEVDENFYPKLYPYITRSYSMIYDSKKGKTSIHDGYFWDEKGEKVIEV